MGKSQQLLCQASYCWSAQPHADCNCPRWPSSRPHSQWCSRAVALSLLSDWTSRVWSSGRPLQVHKERRTPCRSKLSCLCTHWTVFLEVVGISPESMPRWFRGTNPCGEEGLGAIGTCWWGTSLCCSGSLFACTMFQVPRATGTFRTCWPSDTASKTDVAFGFLLAKYLEVYHCKPPNQISIQIWSLIWLRTSHGLG